MLKIAKSHFSSPRPIELVVERHDLVVNKLYVTSHVPERFDAGQQALVRGFPGIVATDHRGDLGREIYDGQVPSSAGSTARCAPFFFGVPRFQSGKLRLHLRLEVNQGRERASEDA